MQVEVAPIPAQMASQGEQDLVGGHPGLDPEERAVGRSTIIRPTALGKKNWLFVGADTAGDRSAILYTVLESCRRRGLDPYAYLRNVLTRLPTLTNYQVPGITPANWARSHPAPRSLAA